MTQLSLAQLHLLLQNETNNPLNRYIPQNELFVTFLVHLHDFFSQSGASFQNLQPVWLDMQDTKQETAIALNGIELGELFLLHDSSSLDTSLVYYSPYATIESILLQFSAYEEYLLSDYVILLREFAFHLYGEYLLYKELDTLSQPPVH